MRTEAAQRLRPVLCTDRIPIDHRPFANDQESHMKLVRPLSLAIALLAVSASSWADRLPQTSAKP